MTFDKGDYYYHLKVMTWHDCGKKQSTVSKVGAFGSNLQIMLF